MKILKRIISINWTNVIKINLLVTLVSLILIEAIFTFTFYVRDNFFFNILRDTTNMTAETVGFRIELRHYREYPYKAFLGWVSPDTQGEYINVAKERRLTFNSKELISDETLHFFGGSAMWGYGVSDKSTIPSMISQNLKVKTINYGEQAYNSRQGLNSLLNNLELIVKDDTVIFYDGVNDVSSNCYNYNSLNGHARELYMRNLLSGGVSSYSIYLQSSSTYRFVRGLANRIFPTDAEDKKQYKNPCADPVYAEKVASFLVANWEAAESILNPKRIKFMCILQPNPYTFDGSIYYSNEKRRSQIELVYPIIRRKAKNLSCFYDYSSVLTQDNYVDACCHLNELGNREVSAQLGKDISRK